MQYTFIIDKDTQLVLKPDNELEKELIASLLKNGKTSITAITQNINILSTNVSGGLIISSKAQDQE